MNDPDDFELIDGEAYVLRVRPKTAIELTLPVDVIASLDTVAHRQGMSREALLRFYIGQGLRSDLSRLFGDQVLEKTASVLSRHRLPVEEVETIVEEIRREAKLVSA